MILLLKHKSRNSLNQKNKVKAPAISVGASQLAVLLLGIKIFGFSNKRVPSLADMLFNDNEGG